MCGIAGIYNYKTNESIQAKDLLVMRDSMVHRGPDGGEIWVNNDDIVGFAHRRLSIVDLSNSASQPMCNETHNVWITFNGEVYNHIGLRKELLNAGHIFKTDHSDTEVLIHGFEEWGIDGLLNKIEGDYAFAIWSDIEKKLYLCRDRVGVKPLYFSFQKNGILFASEIKAILNHPSVVKDVDYMAMYHYLSFLTTPAPLTMFKDIFKLPSGFYLTVDKNGAIETTRYWDAVPGKSTITKDTLGLSKNEKELYFIKGIQERLKAGVEKRMMSDVPIGVFLSGGIDSSVNVALMSKCTDKPLETFTVGFKDYKHLNELEYAKQIADQFKTNHHEILIDEKDMIQYIDQLVYQQDEPLADWVCIPLYFVSKLAKDSGVTVIQVGEGSDEQFAGYRSYMSYLKMEKQFWIPFRKWVPRPFSNIISWLANQISKIKPGFHFYADIISRAVHNKELFWTGATVFWNNMKKELLNENQFRSHKFSNEISKSGLLPKSFSETDSYKVIESFLKPFDKAYPKQSTLTRMTYNEFQLRLPELLLMRVDKITMSVSLESRVPFLDHHLVDFTMDIPQSFKVKNGEAKYLFKKAVEGLIPNSIIYRKKMGFNAPMEEWLRGAFGRKVQDAINSSPLINSGRFNIKYIDKMFSQHFTGKIDNSLYIWTLFNLTAWYKYWILEESSN
jgi:asparagine synthase (glutamine-hydrolysing)